MIARSVLLALLVLTLSPVLAQDQPAFPAGDDRLIPNPAAALLFENVWGYGRVGVWEGFLPPSSHTSIHPYSNTTTGLGITPLREALTFHASFDGQNDATFALGDPHFYTAPSWDDRAKALPRLPMAATAWRAEGGGRFGDGLTFDNYAETIFFFKADKNIAYRETDWSGTVSFWLRLNPDADLKPGEWCDPIQITPRSWDDASLFVDFTREGSRQFRFAAFADTEVWNPSGENWWEMPDGAMPMISIDQPPFSRDQWTHVVMTFAHFNTNAKDGVVAGYLNGQRVGTLTGRQQTLTWDPAQALIRMGMQYVGDFDDLAFFNRALTDEEVKALYELDGGVANLSR